MNANPQPWLFDRGAKPQVLRDLVREVGSLPSSYLKLLAIGNGGEVGLIVSPFILCLDSAEHALDYWRSGTYTMNDIFVFGSSGGSSLFAFDLRKSGEFSVLEFDPIDPEGSIEVVAPDFDGLLELVKHDG